VVDRSDRSGNGSGRRRLSAAFVALYFPPRSHPRLRLPSIAERALTPPSPKFGDSSTRTAPTASRISEAGVARSPPGRRSEAQIKKPMRFSRARLRCAGPSLFGAAGRLSGRSFRFASGRRNISTQQRPRIWTAQLHYTR
jgi:hypothetical protein